jgi:hypothetical protein
MAQRVQRCADYCRISTAVTAHHGASWPACTIQDDSKMRRCKGRSPPVLLKMLFSVRRYSTYYWILVVAVVGVSVITCPATLPHFISSHLISSYLLCPISILQSVLHISLCLLACQPGPRCTDRGSHQLSSGCPVSQAPPPISFPPSTAANLLEQLMRLLSG